MPPEVVDVKLEVQIREKKMPEIQNRKIEAYRTYLKEPSRPPSKGGNTRALHSHVLVIDGQNYSFLALGSQQWVFKADTVSFTFEVSNGYNNISTETLITRNPNGQSIVRGNREYKATLRTAVSRMPGSRREQRD